MLGGKGIPAVVNAAVTAVGGSVDADVVVALLVLAGVDPGALGAAVEAAVETAVTGSGLLETVVEVVGTSAEVGTSGLVDCTAVLSVGGAVVLLPPSLTVSDFEATGASPLLLSGLASDSCEALGLVVELGSSSLGCAEFLVVEDSSASSGFLSTLAVVAALSCPPALSVDPA